MRKPNIRLWTRRLTLTAREAPAEMLLALYFFAIYSLNREHALSGMADYLPLMPIFFALSLLTNRWCRSPRSRIAYRLSPLAAVPFLWADVGGWVHSVAYPVTLIVSALTVFAGGWQRDNARFVERVLRYLSDAIASGLIALAAFLASCAIFFSIVYIFNILDDCSRGFTEYAAMASLLVVWPVLFLILDRDSERDQGNGFASGPFLDVLSNYILTPALLIYTAILYLYFAKIAIGWSLPKGGIAYLVFGYTITALVVQASQTLLQRRRYDWYYRRFGPIALPALAMFWIGVLYRVHQYGFTEARAYLVVCGAVMTLTVLMQFDRRTARYLYATVTGAALLALFTYVPGMTAADIGVRSQSVRADRLIDRLELADPTGRLTLARLTHAVRRKKTSATCTSRSNICGTNEAKSICGPGTESAPNALCSTRSCPNGSENMWSTAGKGRSIRSRSTGTSLSSAARKPSICPDIPSCTLCKITATAGIRSIARTTTRCMSSKATAFCSG